MVTRSIRRAATAALAMFVAIVAAGLTAAPAGAVGSASASVSIVSSANPAVNGADVTFTATVAGAGATPTGNVTFFLDGVAKTTKSLHAGSAVWTRTFSPGSYAIVALYNGSTTYGTASSPPLTQVANKAATTTSIVSSANPAVAGSPVTFAVTVAGVAPGVCAPDSGTLTFKDNTTTLGKSTPTAGVGSLTISNLAVGTHSITVTFAGTSKCLTSTSSALSQTVTAPSTAPTTTALSSTPNPSTQGASVTFTATVATGVGTPTGTVTFADGATVLGATAIVTGAAQLSTSALSVGAHSVTATYGGDAGHQASTSPALVQTVGASSTWYVDRANAHCTNSGTNAGGSATPFCTVNAAAAKATAGITVVVAAGTYPEKVTVVGSGTAAAPITFTPAPGATVALTGGSNGFSITSKSWIVIHGFTVTGTTGVGINVTTSTNVTIDGNHVSGAGQPVSGATAVGIKLNGTTQSTVSHNTTDHNSDAGVLVTTDANGNAIVGNTSFANARGYVRAAAGFDLRNSTGNVVSGNVAYGNEDSGFNMWTGTALGSNAAVDNVAYANGDHGIDVHNAVDARIVANTVFGNYDSGIEMTTSTGSLLANNVSVDNGLTSVRTSGNIRADAPSVGTATVNDDLVYLSSPGVMVDWGGVKYSSLAAFGTATGQESRGREADPRFVAAGAADFHLQAGSPAIDSANTSVATQPLVDFDGSGRYDDPATPDTGVGPVTFADRGAFEYRP